MLRDTFPTIVLILEFYFSSESNLILIVKLMSLLNFYFTFLFNYPKKL